MTGIAGLALGGGLGWLNGKHGLTCDNVGAADLVTADGELNTASAGQNADLHWALRGGGGNFGVVTSLDLRLYPVRDVLAGRVTYPVGKARAALARYHEFASAPSRELSTRASQRINSTIGRPAR